MAHGGLFSAVKARKMAPRQRAEKLVFSAHTDAVSIIGHTNNANSRLWPRFQIIVS